MAEGLTLRETAKALGLPEGTDAEMLGYLRRVIAAGARDHGEMRKYVRDVLDLPPLTFAIDHLLFIATISGAGAVTTQATRISIPQGYDFVLRRIGAFIQEESGDREPRNLRLIRFNAREEGRNRDVFTSSLSLAEFFGDSAFPPQPITSDRGIYRFTGGHAITPNFSVDTDTWSTTVVKDVGISFFGDLILHPSESFRT